MAYGGAYVQQLASLSSDPYAYGNESKTGATPTRGIAGQPSASDDSDNSLVNVPIKMSDLEYIPLAPSAGQEEPRTKPKKSFARKVASALKSPASSHKEVQVIQMTRAEYLKYWAKGDDGYFLPSVVEPPQGRKKWLRDQKVKVAKWNRDDTALHGTYGAALSFQGNGM